MNYLRKTLYIVVVALISPLCMSAQTLPFSTWASEWLGRANDIERKNIYVAERLLLSRMRTFGNSMSGNSWWSFGSCLMGTQRPSYGIPQSAFLGSFVEQGSCLSHWCHLCKRMESTWHSSLLWTWGKYLPFIQRFSKLWVHGWRPLSCFRNGSSFHTGDSAKWNIGNSKAFCGERPRVR